MSRKPEAAKMEAYETSGPARVPPYVLEPGLAAYLEELLRYIPSPSVSCLREHTMRHRYEATAKIALSNV